MLPALALSIYVLSLPLAIFLLIMSQPKVVAKHEVGGPTLRLGPCPFCGNENAKVETQSDFLRKKYAVRCLTCDATGPSTRIEERVESMWLWKDQLARTIEAQGNSAISDALRSYRILIIHNHQGNCEFGSVFNVWDCPEPICHEATQRLLRLIPDPLPDTRQTEPAEETD